MSNLPQTQTESLTPMQKQWTEARRTPKCSELNAEQIVAAAQKLVVDAMLVVGQVKTDKDTVMASVEYLAQNLKGTYPYLTIPEVQIAINKGVRVSDFSYITGANICKFIDQFIKNDRPKIVLELRAKQKKQLPPQKEYTKEEKLNYVVYQKTKHLEGKEAFYVRAFKFMQELGVKFYRSKDEVEKCKTLAVKLLHKDRETFIISGLRDKAVECEKALQDYKQKGKLTNEKAIISIKRAAVILEFESKEPQELTV